MPIVNKVIPELTDKDRARFEKYVLSVPAYTYEGTPCKSWTGARDVYGYGVFSVGGSKYKAHRIACELEGRKHTQGLIDDHLCKNRWCVEPKHIEEVTAAENTRRGNAGQNLAKFQMAKIMCPRSHKLQGKNLRADKAAFGYRVCRSCDNATSKVRHMGITHPVERELMIKQYSDIFYEKHSKEVAE